MMDKGTELCKRIRIRREGPVEVLELGFYDSRNSNRDVDVIVDRVGGDITGSVEDGTKDLGVETLDALKVDWLG